MSSRVRILCVDDEPAVLEGIQRNLRREFDVQLAESGDEGLALLRADPGIAAVVSDMRMPGMDGAAFLANARAIAPDVTRMLLTGQADVNSAILAVNEGSVFRFLTKPCPPADLSAAVRAAVEQHRLVTAERELLERTLRGSVHALGRVLALCCPEAFGRAARVKETVAELAHRLGLEHRWALDVATLMAELGSIVLPPDVLAKVHRGQQLSAPERQMVDRMPAVTEELLSGIPRLDLVRALLRPRSGPVPGAPPEVLERAASVLALARDYDALTCGGASPADAIAVLRGRAGRYDATALVALTDVKTRGERRTLQELPLGRVLPGMLLARDVHSRSGLLLVAHGQRVTTEMLERLGNVAQRMGVAEPIVCEVGG